MRWGEKMAHIYQDYQTFAKVASAVLGGGDDDASKDPATLQKMFGGNAVNLTPEALKALAEAKL